MATYKNITSGDANLLYSAVKNQIDFETGNDTPLADVIILVDVYLQGQIDKADLLADIANELEWIPTEQDNLQNAIDNVIPGLAIPNPPKAVLTGLASNQKRILQEQLRELRAWRFVIKNAKFE